ncbi:MAG: penicillin-binding protein [Flavobacterium sp. BFFFF1]|uniref:serine hydrolase domain-containing protein n=1 Tax=unclassified Flavobacterium TaxID=196869 RepID=UPI000BD34EE4|nr:MULTISPECIES: serine hydrolase domain-containing protein [unclassified Flavobacterium]OYU80295.1 MAG: penicillin-binding protein [Flavobacterium sp. BFFFF1]
MIWLRATAVFTLLSFFLFLASCKDKTPEQNLADGYTKDNPFSVAMPKVSKSYKEDKKQKVEAFFKKNWGDRMNGSFLVAKNGQIIYENYDGYSSIEKKLDITATTPIHIASMSKVLTAALVLRLIDGGKLDLDQDVSTILSPFPYPNITIQDLLDHRSGLPNYAYFCDEKGVWDHSKTLMNQDVLNLMNEHHFPQQFPSGRRFAYCNTNYAMLALVIEKITGMTYPEAMKKMLFEPLHMSNTFVFNIVDKDEVSQTYKGNMRLAFDHLDGTYGDKNIYSTPRDLLKFDMATYSPNFLSAGLVKKVYQGYSYEHKGTRNYGLGIRMYEWPTGQKMYYHNGWWHGNTSSYIKLKKDTVTIIAISNKYTKSTYQAWKLAPSFGDYPFKMDKGEGEE